MGVSMRPDVFMLMKPGSGWQPVSEYSSVLTQGKDRFKVARGSLAEQVDTTKDIGSHSSIQVSILDQKDMKMVAMVADLKRVANKGDQVYQLLRGIGDPEKRFIVSTSGHLPRLGDLSNGTDVLYEDPYTQESVPAVVRFLGQGPEGGPGWVVGVEIQKADWEYGHTDGQIQGKKYFDRLCEEEKGIFCDISQVKFLSTSCDSSCNQNQAQYHANNYAPEIRGSWSQELNKINNNKLNNRNNGKTVNSILEKFNSISTNLIQDKDCEKLHNKIHHVNMDEFERDSATRAGLRRKQSFSSSERPTSRSSSSGPHSRPGSRVQGSFLAEGDEDSARHHHAAANRNSLNSDSFSWNPNSGGRKDASRPPRKSASPKFESSLSAGSTSTSSSGPARDRQRNTPDRRRSIIEQRKVSKKSDEDRKIDGNASSSSSDRKYQPALYDAGHPSEGRSTESTETDSTLGFGRSWDEISKETGYSLLEFQDGRSKIPRDHSYSQLVRSMLTSDPHNQHQMSGNDRSWSSDSRREDMSEMSLDLHETQAESDELTLPFGKSLSRHSDTAISHGRRSDTTISHNLIDWEQEDAESEDWQHSNKNSHNLVNNTDQHSHLVRHDRYDHHNPVHPVAPLRRSEDRPLISPAEDKRLTSPVEAEARSHSRQRAADFAGTGGSRARSRQAGHRTAPFHRTGSSFGRKTPVPVFDSEEDTRRRLSEEEEAGDPGEREDWGNGDRQRSWREVLKSGAPAQAPAVVGSYREKDFRVGEEDPDLSSDFVPPGPGKENQAQFDQLVPDWLKEDLQQVVTGSMVQLEQAGQPLFGVVRWRGSMVGDNVELVDSGDLVGVELEDQVQGGGNGTLKGRSLFTCADGKGVFVPVTHVRPDPRFTESVVQSSTSSSTLQGGQQQQQEFGGHDCPTEPGVYPPHQSVEDVGSIAGRNKGIQGHQNSCYLDATLFSMFTFSSVFDSLLYRPRNKDDIPQYEEVQRVLRDDIVNPLRKRLFVRADRVLTLRGLLDNLSSVSGLMDQEKDPEEFLNSLLNQVLKASPYLELVVGQTSHTSHTYQLFVEKDPSLKIPTVQELFEQSFLTSGIKFSKVPPILILQMPRFGTQFKMYERIIPSLLLDITDVIDGMPRQCISCGQLATIECLKCYGDREQGLQSTAFCSSCYSRLHHNHQTRGNHNGTRLYLPMGRKREEKLTRVCMQLVAVICIETSHYVSFVRCGDTVKAPWAFFDSMADRRGEQNGYNIPELISVPEVDYILSERGAKHLKTEPDLPLTEHARRLVSDSYICIYQSDEVRMYD